MNAKSYYRIVLLLAISFLWSCGGSNFAATQVDPAQSQESESSITPYSSSSGASSSSISELEEEEEGEDD